MNIEIFNNLIKFNIRNKKKLNNGGDTGGKDDLKGGDIIL